LRNEWESLNRAKILCYDFFAVFQCFSSTLETRKNGYAKLGVQFFVVERFIRLYSKPIVTHSVEFYR